MAINVEGKIAEFDARLAVIDGEIPAMQSSINANIGVALFNASAIVISHDAPTSVIVAGTAARLLGLSVYYCDGVNDEAEINAALTAVGTANGGIIQLTPGTFTFGLTGVVVKSKQWLRGAGISSTNITQANNANIPNLLTIDTTTDHNGITDLYVSGNKNNNITGNGIYVRFTNYRGFLKNLEISGCPGRGITVENSGGATTMDWCMWENLSVYNNSLTDHQVYIYGADNDSYFDKVLVASGNPATFTTGSGIYFEHCGGIHGRIDVNTSRVGITMDNCTYTQLEEVVVDSCTDYGIYITGGGFNRIGFLHEYTVGQNGGLGIGVGVDSSNENNFGSIEVEDTSRGLPLSDHGTQQIIVETGTSDYNIYDKVIAKTQFFCPCTFVGLHNHYGIFDYNAAPISGNLSSSIIPSTARNLIANLQTPTPPVLILPPFAYHPTNGIKDYSFENTLSIFSRFWFDKYFAYTVAGGFVDETVAGLNVTDDDMTLMAAAPVVNDCYYFIRNNVFPKVTVNVSTAGVGVWTIVWEYYDKVTASWLPLPGVVDGTVGFTVAGAHDVTWTPIPNGWAKVTVNGVTEYAVRARVSAFTSIVTQPKGERAYCWKELQYTETPMVKAGSSLMVPFNGLNEGIDCGDHDYYSFGNSLVDSPFTMFIVTNPTNVAAIRTLLSKWTLYGPSQEYQIIIDAANKLRCDLWDKSTGKNPFALSNVALTMGVLQVIAVSYDGGAGATAANGIKMYVNGVPFASTPTNDGAYVAMENTTTDLQVGMSTGNLGVPANVMKGTEGWIVIIPAQLADAVVFEKSQLLLGAVGQ